jgi:hypothetical protein
LSHASEELERLSYEAWSDLATDASRTGSRLGKVATQYATKHPVIVIGGGALLAALAFSRTKRDPTRVARRESRLPEATFLSSALGGVLKMWLVETLTSSLTPRADDESSDS